MLAVKYCRKKKRVEENKVRMELIMVKVRYIIGMFFFFQAEDGIRDYKVTGVQTCALPI